MRLPKKALLPKLTLTVGALVWLATPIAKAQRANTRASTPNPNGLHRAYPDPVTGGFRAVTAPKPGHFYSVGAPNPLVTIRLFVPASNAWRLWSRIGNIEALLNRFPESVRVETRPCVWEQYSVTRATRDMVRWVQGKEPVGVMPYPHGGAFLTIGRGARLPRPQLAFRMPLDILASDRGPRKKQQYAEALLRVVEGTLSALSLGITCGRSDEPLVFVGGKPLFLLGSLARRALTERLFSAYQDEKRAAQKALDRGLPRHHLPAWQLARAMKDAMAAHSSLPGRRARDLARALYSRHRTNKRMEGGILVSGSARSGPRVDLFTPFTDKRHFTHLALVMLLARALPKAPAIYLHPLDTRLSAKAKSPARDVVVASLTGSLKKYLDVRFHDDGRAAKASLFIESLKSPEAKALRSKQGRARIEAILTEELRRVTALGRLPIAATVVANGRVVTYTAGEEMKGLLAVYLALQPGILGRIAGDEPVTSSSLRTTRR